MFASANAHGPKRLGAGVIEDKRLGHDRCYLSRRAPMVDPLAEKRKPDQARLAAVLVYRATAAFIISNTAAKLASSVQ